MRAIQSTPTVKKIQGKWLVKVSDRLIKGKWPIEVVVLVGTSECSSTPPPIPLRGPSAIVFIFRDACSDSIAKLFRACFHEGNIARYVAK